MSKRQLLPTFSELIERITVMQLRESLLTKDREKNSKEIAALEHDIDLIIKEKSIKLSARLLRQVFLIAQVNVLIWKCKEEMENLTFINSDDQKVYNEYLRRAHQLNGIRNRIRNLLLVEVGDSDIVAPRSNTNIDGLDFFVSL